MDGFLPCPLCGGRCDGPLPYGDNAPLRGEHLGEFLECHQCKLSLYRWRPDLDEQRRVLREDWNRRDLTAALALIREKVEGLNARLREAGARVYVVVSENAEYFDFKNTETRELIEWYTPAEAEAAVERYCGKGWNS